MSEDKNIVCLKCKAKMSTDYYIEEGDEIVCDRCYTQYEIVNISPLRIEPIDDHYKKGNDEEEYEEDDDYNAEHGY